MKTETKVVPQARDGIPIEVATSMLLEPKAKMTNRMRKQCMMARAKVYPSSAPIKRQTKFDTAEEAAAVLAGKPTYQYLPELLINKEVKIAKRVKGLKYCQLLSHLNRMAKRRATIQRHYIRLHEDPTVDPKDKALMERALSEAAARIELVQEKLEDEIAARVKKVK